MVVDSSSKRIVAVPLQTSELPKIQIQEFTAQVATFITQKTTKKHIQCFHCKQADYEQLYCPKNAIIFIIIVAAWPYCCKPLAVQKQDEDVIEGQSASPIVKSSTDIIVMVTIKIQTCKKLQELLVILTWR